MSSAADGKADDDDGEGKDETEAVEYLDGAEVPDFLARALVFYESRSFNDVLGAFVRRPAGAFAELAEAKTEEEVEHRIEHTALHREYLSEFEAGLATFLEREGCSGAEFFAQCQDALDDKFVALFEEHEHHWFVDALLAGLDYERFFCLMTDECRRQRREKRDGDDDHVGGGGRGGMPSHK